MATSLLVSPLSLPVIDGGESTNSASILPKSSFLANTKLFFAAAAPHPRNSLGRRSFRFPVVAKCSFDRVPKQFLEENLADGCETIDYDPNWISVQGTSSRKMLASGMEKKSLSPVLVMDNFKNVPPSLYGLSPSQMGMFMTEDNALSRQSENVTEESISSAYSYSKGMWSLSSMSNASPLKASTSMNMYRGGGRRGRRGRGRGRRRPPDLPSILLDGRIVWLGLPLVPAVTELIVAEFMWLDYTNSKKPIYLYIHSSGTQNDQDQVIGAETDAFAIADVMCRIKAKREIYTVNMGMAYGQAGMLLALGTKGRRYVAPASSTKLYLPQTHPSGGDTSNMWFMAKDLEANSECYLNFLQRGIGKPKEELKKDIEFNKFFMAQEAIDYGIADKITKRAEKVYDDKKRSSGLGKDV